jgi:hypothetical protein
MTDDRCDTNQIDDLSQLIGQFTSSQITEDEFCNMAIHR